MPHGAPDWYKYRRDSATHPIDDLAELAARLNSPVVFDRRGDVVILDTFKNGRRPWQAPAPGTGANAVLSPDHFLTDGYSLAITCPSDHAFDIHVYRYTPYVPHGTIGLEIAFTLDLYTVSIKMDLTLNDGVNQILTYLLYTYATKRLQYYPASGAAVDLEPIVDVARNPRIFNHLKLVVDPHTPAYCRAILNHQSFDMTDIPARSVPDTTTPNLLVNIEWIGTTGQTPTVYLDNVIITQDEP
jgi:hypothetical protein